MKFKIILLFLLFTLIRINCESQLLLSGKLEGLSNTKGVFYFKPLAGFHNIYYEPTEITFQGDSFQINIPLTEPCFVNLSLPQGNGILYLFAVPGDSIHVKALFQGNVNNKTILNKIEFLGSNAQGHELYTTLKSQFNQQYIIKNIFKERKFFTINEYAENCFVTFDTIAEKFNILVEKGQISEFYASRAMMDLFTYSFSHIFTIFQSFALRDHNLDESNMPDIYKNRYRINKDLYSKNNLEYFKKEIYKRYPPKDELVVNSGLGLLYVQNYYKDVFDGLVKIDLPYDSTFLSLCEDCKYFGYLKGKLLEYQWARTLHWVAITESDFQNLEMNISAFEYSFPNSVLLPYLRKRFSEVLANIKPQSQDSGLVEFLKAEYTSLSQLASVNFENKYVFVDLWATWCSPCVQEFLYKSQLDSLLANKKISILYLSIDKESDKVKWEKFVSYKKLHGTHYLVNQKLVDEIKRTVFQGNPITIPRYILIDRKGKIVGVNLPRPSDINNLALEIDKLLLEKRSSKK